MKTITFWTDHFHMSEANQHINNQIPNHVSSNLAGLDQYIKSFGPLPRGSTYLGTCNDGLPLLFDLEDPTPGSLLLIGDDESSAIRFLNNILVSSVLLNSPSHIRCSVISPNIGYFSDISQSGHLDYLLSSYESAAHKHVVELAILAEQRRSGRHTGAIQLLIINSLSEILKYDDFETANHLGWLASNGPSNSIWLVASLDRTKLDLIDRKIINCFGTYIFSNLNVDHPRLLNHGGSYLDGFTTKIGSETVNFHLPLFE